MLKSAFNKKPTLRKFEEPTHKFQSKDLNPDPDFQLSHSYFFKIYPVVSNTGNNVFVSCEVFH